MPLDPRKCKSYQKQAGGESSLAPRLHRITVEIVFSPAETSKPKQCEYSSYVCTLDISFVVKGEKRRQNHMATVVCKKVVGLQLF